MFEVLFSMLIFEVMLKVGTFSVPYNLPRKKQFFFSDSEFPTPVGSGSQTGMEDQARHVFPHVSSSYILMTFGTGEN
jgi:hypothetical protein